jgi:Cu-processing system permease protein
MAVLTWFAFVLLYDLVLVGSLAVSGVPAPWLAAALIGNPIDAARILGVLALEPDLYLLGPAGSFLTTRLSSAGTAGLLAGALAVWALAPVLAAAIKFSLRGRLFPYAQNRVWPVAVHRRAGDGGRVLVQSRVDGVRNQCG